MTWKKWAFRLLWAIMYVSGPFALIYGIMHQEWFWLMGTLLMIPIVGGGFGADIALHRYLTHRSFQTTKFKHILMSLAAFMSGQGSAIHYACVHRHHHRHSDKDKDVHCPRNQGIIDSGFMWMTRDLIPIIDRDIKLSVRDLLSDPLNKFLDVWYYHLWLMIIVVGSIISWKALLFLILAPASKGYLEIFLTNTLMHTKTSGSYRNFDTDDCSQNRRWYSWFCLGQGMHNNHHACPGAYHLKLAPNDVDPAGDFIEKFLLEKNQSKIYNF